MHGATVKITVSCLWNVKVPFVHVICI